MNSFRYCIDTNIFILLFNGRLQDQLPSGELACSIITEMELLSFPQLTQTEELLIRKHIERLKIYHIDQNIKEKTIRLRRDTRLKLPDEIIAATAITHDCVLLTNDKVFFEVQGLKCLSLAQRNEAVQCSADPETNT